MIYNWVVNYFNNRSHIISHQGALSRLVVINASMIQGSVMGPPSYIVQASGLHPVHVFNALMKYADDSYLLVGSNNLSTATEEFDHILNWAGANNLRLNPQKTKELIVFKSAHRRVMSPSNPIIQGAVRVTTLRVLNLIPILA